jgi:hypothetical protein
MLDPSTLRCDGLDEKRLPLFVQSSIHRVNLLGSLFLDE